MFLKNVYCQIGLSELQIYIMIDLTHTR